MTEMRGHDAEISGHDEPKYAIRDEPQHAHVVSYRGWKMDSPVQEVSHDHDDEPSAISTWTLDG